MNKTLCPVCLDRGMGEIMEVTIIKNENTKLEKQWCPVCGFYQEIPSEVG